MECRTKRKYTKRKYTPRATLSAAHDKVVTEHILGEIVRIQAGALRRLEKIIQSKNDATALKAIRSVIRDWKGPFAAIKRDIASNITVHGNILTVGDAIRLLADRDSPLATQAKFPIDPTRPMIDRYDPADAEGKPTVDNIHPNCEVVPEASDNPFLDAT